MLVQVRIGASLFACIGLVQDAVCCGAGLGTVLGAVPIAHCDCSSRPGRNERNKRFRFKERLILSLATELDLGR